VTSESGTRAVVRRYRPQPAPHTAPARLRRERWALSTVRAAHAPVPRVLASTEEPGRESLLLELAEGELLGSVVRRLSPEEADSAWAAAGRALAAVHSVDGARAEAAGCEAAGIPAPFSSRGLYHLEEALAHLDALSRSRPDLPPLQPLRTTVEDARPLYEAAPLVLCQYDVHLWQFVLARRSTGWECTVILDWEHADLDDPDWDLAQLDVFRFEDVGPTPPAFFEAYGREPGALYPLYRLERAVWILDAFARGEDWLALSAPPAEAYLRTVLAELG
jgi:aminoglycoside phosphotransferase (APT) family kinase protein